MSGGPFSLVSIVPLNIGDGIRADARPMQSERFAATLNSPPLTWMSIRWRSPFEKEPPRDPTGGRARLGTESRCCHAPESPGLRASWGRPDRPYLAARAGVKWPDQLGDKRIASCPGRPA